MGKGRLGWQPEARERSIAARRRRQAQHDAEVGPRIEALRRCGFEDSAVARLLDLDAFPTPRRARWTRLAVRRIRARLGIS